MPTTYYCPLCGQPLTIHGVQHYPRKDETVVSCKDNPGCRLRRQTTTVESIAAGVFQDCWNFRNAYDFQTGVKIEQDSA